MKGNNDKHHFIISTKKTYQIFVDNSSVGSGKCGKLLKVKIDPKLTFEDHVKDICQKAIKKLRALAGAAAYMETGKKIFFS